MAVSVQSKCAMRSAPVRARAVRVEAVHGAVERTQVASFAAAFAAAALLVAPAQAGVVMQQPTLKKAFVDDSPAKVRSAGISIPTPFGASKSAPAAEAKKEKKEDEAPTSDIIDPRLVALPVSIGFVGGLALLGSKLDEEFDDFLKATLIKDSNVGEAGLGYEVKIKSTYGGIYGEPTSAAGTKKVKAAKKK